MRHSSSSESTPDDVDSKLLHRQLQEVRRGVVSRESFCSAGFSYCRSNSSKWLGGFASSHGRKVISLRSCSHRHEYEYEDLFTSSS